MKYFFVTVGTFAVACLMMGSAIEKGLKSPNVHIITTCVNVTSSVTPVSNLTNETVQQFSLSCSDNTESVKLQIAMAVTFMVGLIQVCITSSIERYWFYEMTYIFFSLSMHVTCNTFLTFLLLKSCFFYIWGICFMYTIDLNVSLQMHVTFPFHQIVFIICISEEYLSLKWNGIIVHYINFNKTCCKNTILKNSFQWQNDVEIFVRFIRTKFHNSK